MNVLFYLVGLSGRLPTLFEVMFSFPSLHAWRCLSGWPDFFNFFDHLYFSPLFSVLLFVLFAFNFSDVKSQIFGVKVQPHVEKIYLDDVIYNR